MKNREIREEKGKNNNNNNTERTFYGIKICHISLKKLHESCIGEGGGMKRFYIDIVVVVVGKAVTP